MKKWTLMFGMVIGAMVFGLAAFAAAPYIAQAQAGATATSAPGTTNATPAPGTTAVAPNGGDQQGDLPGAQESDLLINAAASVTGLTTQEVTTQLQSGQSLAQIAQSKSKTAADVIQSARGTLSTLLQQAVTAGTITQAQADAELAEYDQRAPQMANNAGLNNKQGRGFGAHGRGGPQGEHALVSAASSVTGLTAQEVMTQLQAGQSLAQIAQSKGKTAADLIQAARASLSTQLQQAVTAGNITQAQADAELANFDQQAPQIVANTGLGVEGAHGPGFGRGGPGGEGALISAAASVTGLTAQEVQTQLQAGQSLAQIAQSKGKTAADVIQAARASLSTQLQQAVTAGNITQAQADARLAQFNQSATQLVNDTTLGQEAGEHGGQWQWGGPNGQSNPANPTPTGPTGSNTTNS
jgi:hypothetical protein